jgi:hypothetical protein
LILDEMQVFDQQVAPARLIGQKGLDLLERLRVDLPPLGRSRRPAAAACSVGACPRRILDVHFLTSDTI